MKKQPRNYRLFGCVTAVLLCLQQADNLLMYQKSQTILTAIVYYALTILSLSFAVGYAVRCIHESYTVEVVPILQTGLSVHWYALLTQSSGNAAVYLSRAIGLITVLIPLLLHVLGNNKRVYRVSTKVMKSRN